MTSKIVYTGIIILAIGVVFYFLGSGYYSLPSSNFKDTINANTITASTTDNQQQISSFSVPISVANKPSSNVPSSYLLSAYAQQPSPSQQQSKVNTPNYQNLSLSVKSIDAVPFHNKTRMQIAFNVYNPNKGTVILETMSYNVFLNNKRLISGDIGTRPEGFVDSLASVYPIIGNQTVTLKDKQIVTNDGGSLFDSKGKLIQSSSNATSSTNSYNVNGTFSYTMNRGSDAQSHEYPFSFKFHVK